MAMESREEMGRELTKGQFKFKVFGQRCETYDCKCVVVRRSLWTLLQFSDQKTNCMGGEIHRRWCDRGSRGLYFIFKCQFLTTFFTGEITCGRKYQF